MRNSRAFRLKISENRKTVLNDKQTFGIEKLIRIVLVCTPWWIFIGNWIKVATDNSNVFSRRVFIEAFVIAKVVFFWMLVINDYADHKWVIVLMSWLAIETFYALLGSVFLRDVWSAPFSYQRNLILTLMNYMEICLFFAALYRYEEVNQTTTNGSLFVISADLKDKSLKITSSQAIYFSFVTASTVGYGDISAKDAFIQKLVIIQVVISLIIAVMFISNTAGKMGTGTLSRGPDEETS